MYPAQVGAWRELPPTGLMEEQTPGTVSRCSLDSEQGVVDQSAAYLKRSYNWQPSRLDSLGIQVRTSSLILAFIVYFSVTFISLLNCSKKRTCPSVALSTPECGTGSAVVGDVSLDHGPHTEQVTSGRLVSAKMAPSCGPFCLGRRRSYFLSASLSGLRDPSVQCPRVCLFF